jgi:threonyl-tRNA synthetase
MGCFDFLSKIYETFGFQFKLVLSTRNPLKYLGSIETWNNAEAALADALDERVGPGKWKMNPEDGAFYGPKVCGMSSGSD